MKAASNFTNSSIYVGTFGKYSRGSIAGQWLNISDYESKTEFLQACKELHSDEAGAEFAKRYFDYSAFARDLFITDYSFFDGFVFRR